MADAYALDLTSGVLTKNSVTVSNLLVVKVVLQRDYVATYPGQAVPVLGFTLIVKNKDTGALARIQAQGPNGLIPESAGAAFAPRAEFISKRGDTLALANVPGSITSGITGNAPLSEESAYTKIGV